MSNFSNDNFKENRDKILESITSNFQSLSSILDSNKGTFNEIYDGLTRDFPQWYGKESLEGATKMMYDVCNAMFRDFTQLIGSIVLFASDQVVVSQSLSLQELEQKFGIRLPVGFSYEHVHTQNLLIESDPGKKEIRQLLIIQNTHEQIVKEIERIKYERPNFFALILIVNPLLPKYIIENPERQIKSNEESSNKNIWLDRLIKMEIPTINTFAEAIDSVRSWVYDVEQAEDKNTTDMIQEGIKLTEDNRFEDALLLYDKALELNSKAAEAWYHKGLVYFKLKMYQQALDCYNKAIEINPNYYDVFYGKGLVLYEVAKYEEALGEFERALSADQNDYNSLYNKGLALSKLERDDDALKAFDKAIEIDPNQYGPWYHKGLAYYKLGKYLEALECYKKALDLKPKDTKALFDIGTLLNAIGNYQEAVKYFDDAIKTSPKFADAFYGRAVSNSQKNSIRNVIADLRKAFEIGKVDDKDFFRKKAIQDENFENVKEDKRFKELINSYTPRNIQNIHQTPINIEQTMKPVIIHQITPAEELPKEGVIQAGGKAEEFKSIIKQLNDTYYQMVKLQTPVDEFWEENGGLYQTLRFLNDNKKPFGLGASDDKKLNELLSQIPYLLSSLRAERERGDEEGARLHELKLRELYYETLDWLKNLSGKVPISKKFWHT